MRVDAEGRFHSKPHTRARVKKELRTEIRSPLRYPGGKSRAVETLLPLIPRGTQSLCAPFFGGGSIELACVARGMKVYGYDLFRPLVDFWREAIKDPVRLTREVRRFYPLSRERFYDLQKRHQNLQDPLERAAVFYVLNRASFSGSTLSGGMSPGHPRFTESSLQRLADFKAPGLKVARGDFRKTIPKHADDFLYLDPPYLISNTLYGVKGDTHRDFPHEELRELLVEREGWILSYNNCSEILYLYRGFPVVFPEWKYGMSNDKSSKEVLIFSKDLKKQVALKYR